MFSLMFPYFLCQLIFNYGFSRNVLISKQLEITQLYFDY